MEVGGEEFFEGPSVRWCGVVYVEIHSSNFLRHQLKSGAKNLTEKEACQLNQGALHIAYCN